MLEVVVVEAGMAAIVHRVQVGVDGAGGHLVEAGLPDMDGAAVHQGDAGPVAPAQAAAQSSRQGQTTGATADDDYVGGHECIPEWEGRRSEEHTSELQSRGHL